jgi:hypothetical protein
MGGDMKKRVQEQSPLVNIQSNKSNKNSNNIHNTEAVFICVLGNDGKIFKIQRSKTRREKCYKVRKEKPTWKKNAESVVQKILSYS